MQLSLQRGPSCKCQPDDAEGDWITYNMYASTCHFMPGRAHRACKDVRRCLHCTEQQVWFGGTLKGQCKTSQVTLQSRSLHMGCAITAAWRLPCAGTACCAACRCCRPCLPPPP